jgi:hypothetical protein
VQAGAQHKMALEQGAGTGEYVEDLLLVVFHRREPAEGGPKNKINFATHRPSA